MPGPGGYRCRRRRVVIPSPPGQKPRRVLMRVIDAGVGNCVGENLIVHLKCHRCGHDDGWWNVKNKTEATMQPCPKCNVDQAERREG